MNNNTQTDAISLLPLDVGFDLRATRTAVDLPAGECRVRYLSGNQELTVRGDRLAVGYALLIAGYRPTSMPISLLDRRVPQPGEYAEYGVPEIIVEVVDDLYERRNDATDDDVDILDGAIMRLLLPWARVESVFLFGTIQSSRVTTAPKVGSEIR